jgi:putative phage-type endonuclease
MSKEIIVAQQNGLARDRSQFIGGSDIAAILGVSPWKTAYELWEEKVEGFEKASSEAREKVLHRGKKLEPIVIEMLQEERDVWVLERNQIYVDPEHPFLCAEIDFEFVTDADCLIVERGRVGNGDVKTVHPYAAKDWGEEGTDEFPVYYCAQFQFGLMVTGRQICMVAALIGADDLRVYEVNRDEELIVHIRQTAVNFWRNHILAKVPPPVQSVEDVRKALARFQGTSFVADDETVGFLDTIKTIKAQEKALEANREGLELEVKKRFLIAAEVKGVPGDTEKFAFVGSDGRPLVTWNEQTANRIDQKLIKELYPDAVGPCTVQSKSRVLRVK